MHMIRYAAAAAAFATAPLSASAADPLDLNEGHWRFNLQKQLKAEKGCDLNEVVTYQEIPLGGDVGVDGRISCFDGREFNFSRKRKLQDFTIELCGAAAC